METVISLILLAALGYMAYRFWVRKNEVDRVPVHTEGTEKKVTPTLDVVVPEVVSENQVVEAPVAVPESVDEVVVKKSKTKAKKSTAKTSVVKKTKKSKNETSK